MFTKETMLHVHLTCNHYPPPAGPALGFIKSLCTQALEAAADDDWERKLICPLTNRKLDALSVSKVIEDWHLHSFLEEVEELDELGMIEEKGEADDD